MHIVTRHASRPRRRPRTGLPAVPRVAGASGLGGLRGRPGTPPRRSSATVARRRPPLALLALGAACAPEIQGSGVFHDETRSVPRSWASGWTTRSQRLDRSARSRASR